MICLAPFVIALLLGAMSPQTDYDVVEYHLGGPKEWFQRGRSSAASQRLHQFSIFVRNAGPVRNGLR